MGARAGARLVFVGGPGSGQRLTVWVLAASVLGSSFSTLVSGLCRPAAAQSRSEHRYIDPVDGPVIRRYEEPPGPYAKGHRGIDYGVAAGTVVNASNKGTVTFAGPVADDGLFVTVRHSDGLETLYSFLSRIDVAASDVVTKGQQIALSGDGHPGGGAHALHFAAKENGQYIDPELVLKGDRDDISDALALVPVKESGTGEEGQGQDLRAQGSYFGSPEGGYSGFTTSHPRGRPYGTDGGGSTPFRGSGKRARGPASSSAWAPDGYAGDRSQSSSWQRSRDRIGRLLVDDEESPLFSRQAADRAKAEGDRERARRDSSTAEGRTSAGRKTGLSERLERSFAKRAQSLSDWSITRLDKVATFMLTRWERFKLWVAKQADLVGDFLEPPAAWGTEAFIQGLASGLFHQIGCSLRGGDPPPKMPTAQQFRSGQVKPPPAPSNNIVMVLGGLGSSSTENNGKVTGNASLFKLDFRTLGFKEDQIYHYSYKGVKKRSQTGPYRIHAPYQETDTYKNLKASAERLNEQLKEIHRENPDRTIDLVAHSEGGLVAQYFVSYIYDTSDSKHPELGHLVTLNTPHQGADLARMGGLFSDTATGRIVRPPVEGVLAALAGAPPASAPVLTELEEDSDFIRDLKKNSDARKVKTTTIGTAMDWVVTAPHSSIPNSNHYTTDLDGFTFSNIFKAHSVAATSSSTQGLVYNALAGRRSQCTAFRNAVARYVSGPAISTMQDSAIHAAQAQFYVTDWWATMGGNTGRRKPTVVTQ